MKFRKTISLFLSLIIVFGIILIPNVSNAAMSYTVVDDHIRFDNYDINGMAIPANYDLTSYTIPMFIGDYQVTEIGADVFKNYSQVKNVTVSSLVDIIADKAMGYDENGNKIEDFTIIGYSNTAAEKYAKDNGFNFVSLGDKPDKSEIIPQISPETVVGKTGDCSWAFEPSEGKLTIYGMGDTGNYHFDSDVYLHPFNSAESEVISINAELVKKVEVLKGVKTLGDYIFCFCNNIETVKLADTVNKIGAYAFCDCSKLKEIKFPENIELASGAFKNCSFLKEVTLPDNVRISYYESECGVFDGCTGLTEITVPYNSKSAFTNCPEIRKITFKEGVERISEDEEFSLRRFKKLEIISLPESLKSIGVYSFTSLGSLKEINIPEAVTEIKEGAFYGCSSLEKINLKSGIKSLGYNAFAHCNNLKSFNIPDTLTELDGTVFDSDENIQIDVDENNKTFSVEDGNLTTNNGTSLVRFFPNGRKNYTISDKVRWIGRNAFSGLKILESVVIPEGVTFIGDQAFFNCVNIKSMTIPESVISIGSDSLGRYMDEKIKTVGGFELNGFAGSSAEIYAAEKNMTFKINEKSSEAKDSENNSQSEPSKPSITSKKDNPLKVSVKTKTLKLKKIQKKAQKVKAITVKNNQGKVTYKLVKNGITKKIRKLVKINSKGVITIKKWKKAKKGTYKIKVTVKAAGNANYNAKTITKTIKVKVK